MLSEKLQPLWEKEKAVMLQYKEEEANQLGIPFDNKLNFWDFRLNHLISSYFGIAKLKVALFLTHWLTDWTNVSGV